MAHHLKQFERPAAPPLKPLPWPAPAAGPPCFGAPPSFGGPPFWTLKYDVMALRPGDGAPRPRPRLPPVGVLAAVRPRPPVRKHRRCASVPSSMQRLCGVQNAQTVASVMPRLWWHDSTHSHERAGVSSCLVRAPHQLGSPTARTPAATRPGSPSPSGPAGRTWRMRHDHFVGML